MLFVFSVEIPFCLFVAIEQSSNVAYRNSFTMKLVMISRQIHAEILEGLSSGILICWDNNVSSAEKYET